jgi:hypothetical protein
MSGFIVGITVGTFVGIGITIFCLLQNRNPSPAMAEVWIDEALENAIRAVERKY